MEQLEDRRVMAASPATTTSTERIDRAADVDIAQEGMFTHANHITFDVRALHIPNSADFKLNPNALGYDTTIYNAKTFLGLHGTNYGPIDNWKSTIVHSNNGYWETIQYDVPTRMANLLSDLAEKAKDKAVSKADRQEARELREKILNPMTYQLYVTWVVPGHNSGFTTTTPTPTPNPVATPQTPTPNAVPTPTPAPAPIPTPTSSSDAHAHDAAFAQAGQAIGRYVGSHIGDYGEYQGAQLGAAAGSAIPIPGGSIVGAVVGAEVGRQAGHAVGKAFHHVF